MTETDNQAALGNVYVFNYWSEEVETLTVNGKEVTKGEPGIAGWSKGEGSEAAKYTPAGLAVPRAQPAEEVPGKFGLGNQDVRVQWPTTHRKVPVHIPNYEESGVNVTENMILLLSPYVAILLSPNAHLLNQQEELEAV